MGQVCELASAFGLDPESQVAAGDDGHALVQQAGNLQPRQHPERQQSAGQPITEDQKLVGAFYAFGAQQLQTGREVAKFDRLEDQLDGQALVELKVNLLSLILGQAQVLGIAGHAAKHRHALLGVTLQVLHQLDALLALERGSRLRQQAGDLLVAPFPVLPNPIFPVQVILVPELL